MRDYRELTRSGSTCVSRPRTGDKGSICGVLAASVDGLRMLPTPPRPDDWQRKGQETGRRES